MQSRSTGAARRLWTEHDIRAFELAELQRQARESLGARWVAADKSLYQPSWQASWQRTITVWFEAHTLGEISSLLRLQAGN